MLFVFKFCAFFARRRLRDEGIFSRRETETPGAENRAVEDVKARQEPRRQTRSACSATGVSVTRREKTLSSLNRPLAQHALLV